MLGERKWYLNTHFYYSPMQNWATANVGSRNKSLQQIERGMQKTYSAAARFFWKGQVLFHSLRFSIYLLLSIVNMHVSNCGRISSVGRAVNGRAEGRRPDQHSGSEGTPFALQAWLVWPRNKAFPSPVGDLNSVPVSIGSITSAVQEIEPTISRESTKLFYIDAHKKCNFFSIRLGRNLVCSNLHAYVKPKLLKQPTNYWRHYSLNLSEQRSLKYVSKVCYISSSSLIIVYSRSRLQEANQECTEMKKKLQECMAQGRDLAVQNAKKDKLIKESDENARKQVDQVSTNSKSTYQLRVYHNLLFS